MHMLRKAGSFNNQHIPRSYLRSKLRCGESGEVVKAELQLPLSNDGLNDNTPIGEGRWRVGEMRIGKTHQQHSLRKDRMAYNCYYYIARKVNGFFMMDNIEGGDQVVSITAVTLLPTRATAIVQVGSTAVVFADWSKMVAVVTTTLFVS